MAQVGMSGSFLAVTDLRAEVLWVRQIQQDVALGPEALFRTLRRGFIEGLEELGKAHTKVYGIGIGLPGDIEIATARTTATSAMHDWADFPLTNRLEEAFGAPAFVDRDVNLMAVGERSTSWPDADVFICLKVGTVIACGVVVGDQVIRGVGGLAGEVGHTKLQSNSLACACGSVGCLNTVAGGAALAEQLQKMGHPAKTARDVTILANSGIAEAGSAVRTAGTQVGEVMALLVNVLNPAVITVWGYLVDAGDQFLAGMEESIYRYALPASARAVTITRVRLGDQAGLRGAALAVIEKAFDISSMDKLVAAQR
ncbi:MAG TPA: ROK family protein [Arthrobacter sp.]|nr:ROK family protein [Arthrobacter sp.]